MQALQTAAQSASFGPGLPRMLERHAHAGDVGDPAFLFPIRPFAALEPDLRQLNGRFHAGAIIALADETATAAAMWETNPTGDSARSPFPLTVKMSANLIRKTDRDALVTEAEIVHRGRPTLVVAVEPRGR